MTEFIADTMAYVLWLEQRKMPEQVARVFTRAESGEARIVVPAMVLAEIGYLAEKRRIETTLHHAVQYIEESSHIREQPLTADISNRAFTIDDIPELHDRLIVAGGVHCDCAILTNDPKIHQSKFVEAVW